MGKKEKTCRRCRKLHPIEDIVDWSGRSNSRGCYCRECNIAMVAEAKAEAQAEFDEYLEKLHIVYGQYWRHYANPSQFQTELQSEREFCPYCGQRFENTAPMKLNGVQIHLDHMDPLHRGGEHSIRNVVYCCGECNLRKGRMTYLKWLEQLTPEQQVLARQIYLEKHGHPPEDFIEGLYQGRVNDPELIEFQSIEEVKRSYTAPAVAGPPSNRPIVVTIDVAESVRHYLAQRKAEPRGSD